VNAARRTTKNPPALRGTGGPSVEELDGWHAVRVNKCPEWETLLTRLKRAMHETAGRKGNTGGP
jgi:hypothetical protein